MIFRRKPKPTLATCTPADITSRPGVVKLEGPMKDAVETGRNRLVMAGVVFGLIFCVLAGRLAWLTVPHGGVEPTLAEEAGEAPVKLSASQMDRQPIVDRNGQLLATNLKMASLYADPRQIANAQAAADSLAAVLPDLNRDEIAGRLASGKSFVWIKRNLTPRQQFEVNRLGIPGLQFQVDQRRLYPLGPLTVHTVGFTDIDNRGLAGLEQKYDSELRDGARSGQPMELSLDMRVQHALRDELMRAVDYFSAIGAGGVVLDVNTGEVLALVSLPDFDPAQPGDASKDARFNRITLGVYEMGSTMKTLNTAMALDSGLVKTSSIYNVTAPIKVARFTITDTHPLHHPASVPEIYMVSSNIGSAKMALDVGPTGQREFMERLGMLRKASFDMPEVGAPLVPRNWKQIETMTIAFGHGLSVSPLQLATSTAAIVNGGIFRPATLMKKEEGVPVEGRRVIKPEVSDLMRKMMYLVVEGGGTGKKAAVDGYLVGGKTGTAEKVGEHGGYQKKKLLTSFVGVFPLTKPRYLVIGVLDEPKGRKETYGFATAGWNAAPTVGRVIARIAPILGVPPVDEDSAEIKAQMAIPGFGPQEKKLASN